LASLLIFSLVTFTIVYSFGVGLGKALPERFSCERYSEITDTFFLGLLGLSVICSWASIYFPLDTRFFLAVSTVSAIIWATKFKDCSIPFRRLLNNYRLLSNADRLFLIFIGGFLMLVTAGGITVVDSSQYHAQAINWSREYSVIPGLGNLHDRFAFGSLFFPLNALFSFDFFIGEFRVLLYPLNAVCFTVLLVKLLEHYWRSKVDKNVRGAVEGLVLGFLCLVYLSTYASSPSPDLICAALIIYILHKRSNWSDAGPDRGLIVVSGLCFIAVTYKLSSIPILLVLLTLLNREDGVRRLFLFSLMAVVCITPFFIRNYFLSGYLIYPFAQLDIFTVDWKIPAYSVEKMSQVIAAWARIPFRPPDEVLALPFSKWLPIWFARLHFLTKIVLLLNLALIPLLFFRLARSGVERSIFVGVIVASLVFWILLANDPRFGYGFLFFGGTLVITQMTLWACRVQIMRKQILRGGFFTVVTGVLSIALAWGYRDYLVHTLNHPTNWIIAGHENSMKEFQLYPDPLVIVRTSNFDYGISRPSPCYASRIPCSRGLVSEKIVLRGAVIEDGFRMAP